MSLGSKLKGVWSCFFGEDAAPKRLQGITLFLSLLCVSAYVFKFGVLNPFEWWGRVSSSPEDWAFLGNFVTGTVGVLVLIGTLDALVISINKQSRLINQQDNMIDQQDDLIKQQEKQAGQLESHQRKIEAYSRAEKFFPALLSSCLKDLEVNVVERMESNGWPHCRSLYVSPHMQFKDFFDERLLFDKFEKSGNVYFSGVWSEFLQKPYSLAVLIADCLENAGELRSFFLSEIGSYQRIMACSLIYIYPLYPGEVEKISEVLGFPLDYSGKGMAETKWQEAGRETFNKRG